ncbi:DUF2382 domain-containing protein [Sodalis sp. RH14]|uniref:DUF2382 domain-containing protein n=1 Tax=Sodalis sp. RH14 TaxID=3394329 RepID=UPI0039B62EEA
MDNKNAPDSDRQDNDNKIIPLAEEHAELNIARVVDRRLRVTRTTHSEEQLLAAELYQEQIDIEHIAKNEELEEGRFPPIRQEGDVMIIPVVEERVEIIRRYILKEEVHIRKLKKETPFQEKVNVRRQEINIIKDDEEER